jgi:hypothetical protein
MCERVRLRRERGREIERGRVYQELRNGETKSRAQQYKHALRQRVIIGGGGGAGALGHGGYGLDMVGCGRVYVASGAGCGRVSDCLVRGV